MNEWEVNNELSIPPYTTYGRINSIYVAPKKYRDAETLVVLFKDSLKDAFLKVAWRWYAAIIGIEAVMARCANDLENTQGHE